MTEQVKNSSAVLLHFSLMLEDGSVAESTKNSGKPALFRLGDNSLSPELESQLIGLKVGDKHRFTLQPEDAFGSNNPDLVQFFTRKDFAHTGVPDPGAIILFTAMDGSEMPGLIREVACDSITVDFNHPLAGHPVTFDVEIVEIDPQVRESESKNADIAG